MNRAVFLDRDGVLNAMVYRPDEGIYDSPYCLREFHLLPGVSEAIAGIHRLGMLAIVVSNQPGVAKGKCDDATLDALTQHMCQELMRHHVSVDDIYYCKHHPEGRVARLRQECGCRKPKPGLLFQAAQKYSIDLVHSYMIGDSPKDIEAGQAAGCRTIWIRGPNGGQMAPGVTPHVVTVDVLSAVREIEQGGN